MWGLQYPVTLIQVFAIEFGDFAIEFVPFAIEFVAFAIEFVPFAIDDMHTLLLERKMIN